MAFFEVIFRLKIWNHSFGGGPEFNAPFLRGGPEFGTIPSGGGQNSSGIKKIYDTLPLSVDMFSMWEKHLPDPLEDCNGLIMAEPMEGLPVHCKDLVPFENNFTFFSSFELRFCQLKSNSSVTIKLGGTLNTI